MIVSLKLHQPHRQTPALEVGPGIVPIFQMEKLRCQERKPLTVEWGVQVAGHPPALDGTVSRGAWSPLHLGTAMLKPVWPPPTWLPGPILPENLHNIPTGLRSQPSTRYITEWSGRKGGMPFPYFPFSVSYLSTGNMHCFCNSRKIEGLSLFLSRVTCHQRLKGLSSFSCFFEEGPGWQCAG